MYKYNEFYDNHPMAEMTTIYQRARILNTAKYKFTDLDNYEDIKQYFHLEIVECADQNHQLSKLL